MPCPACQYENAEGANFCAHCGARLTRACPACAAPVAAGDRFCATCGQPLELGAGPAEAMPAAAAEGERRQVTVLFADLVGYTRLSEDLDAEETHGLLNRFFDAADGVVRGFGGVIDKHVGDSVMALFGAPVAHDDDPLRAVRAALDIHSAVAALEPPLAVHIGIASGQVVASDTGSAAHHEYTVTGPTVNLAARLQDLAAARETLLSDAVHAAVAPLVVAEAREAVAIKGLVRPVRVWRLLEPRTEADCGPTAPLVGRRRELRLFEGALDGCRESGKGQAIHVRAEAGLGKTRLVEEFRRLARDRGFACHAGQALDFGAGRDRDPIRAVVRSLLGLAADSGESARAAAADSAITDGLVPADGRVHLNDLLGLPQPAALAALDDAMDNAGRNRGRQATAAGLLRAAAARTPSLVVVEDVHWADGPVLAHLGALAGVAADCPAILVTTARPDGDPMGRAWHDTAHGAPLIAVDLAPLAPEEATALAASYVETMSRFARSCITRADGNPLFLEQLLHTAEETTEDGIPGSIQSLVLARIDRLDGADKQALLAASVIGQRFTLELLRRLIERPDYDCAALVARYLIRPDGEDYLFAHALIREGVYASLLKARRRELHRRAAAWYADRDPVLHAAHLGRAEDGAAPAAFLAAARSLAAEYRFEAAADMAAQGLELAGDRTEQSRLTRFRAEMLLELGDPAASIAAYRRAVELSDDDAERARAWIGVAAGVRLLGEYEPGIAALEAAEAIAGPRGMDLELAQIHYYRGAFHFGSGDVDGCLDQHRRALDHAGRADSPEWSARALSGLGDAHYARARMRTALDCFERCLALCRAHGLGRIEVANRYLVGNLGRYLNRSDEALEDVTAAAESARALGNLRARMIALNLAGEFLVERGEWDRAEAPLAEAAAIAAAMGNERFGSYIMHQQARRLLGLGRARAANKLLDQALAIARRTRLSFIGPRILGTIAIAAGDAARRQAALAEGEAVVRAGCTAHNALWFRRDAIDAALAAADWAAAERHADALAHLTREEPLPWAELFIARGRALAAHGRGARDAATYAELRRLRAIADGAAIKAALPALDAALAEA